MAKKLTVLVVSSLVSLLLCEILCRLTLPPASAWWPRGMFVADPDPILRYRLSPNFQGVIYNQRFHYHLRTNSLGFRGPEQDWARGSEVVGLFGDSFCFGEGLEEPDTFAAILQRALPDRDYQVLNTGVMTYNTAQEYRVYKELVKKVPVQTVVLEVFQNDVEDQTVPTSYGAYHGTLYRQPPKTTAARLGAWALEHSEFVAQLWWCWRFRRTVEDLEAIFSTPAGKQTLLVTTFPRALKLDRSELQAMIEKWWVIDRKFPGTIGDGEISVWKPR